MTGSAPTSPELRTWFEEFLEIQLVEGYGSTESGTAFIDGGILRPQVLDYKLVDVPDLGYFSTDVPHPRGEFLIKTQQMFPGYYKRAEITAEVFDADGYYRTGDIVAEVGPDQLGYVDRRNNVFKLSQGEFVTVSKLEAVFGQPAGPADLRLRQQRAAVPAGRRRAHRGCAGRHDRRSSSRRSPRRCRTSREAGLQSYEVPRDFIVETTPFTLENGLLTGIRKLARPKLKEHYGDRLEQLYADLADGQANELHALRQHGADAPALETVSRAASALLGAAASDVPADAQFTDLGGDSLSALTFANLLHDIFDVDVPVGVIVSPASDLRPSPPTSRPSGGAPSGRPLPRCTAATRPRCTPAT